MPTNQVAVLSPEGDAGYIPAENLQAAQAKGFKQATQVTSPEGDSGWMPTENVADAIKSRGFKAGQPTQNSEKNAAPMSTWDAVKGIGSDLVDTVKGAAKQFAPPQNAEEAAANALAPGALPMYRTIKGIVQTGRDATHVPAMIHDINQSPDPTTVYANAAQRTASQGAAQAVVGAATEGVAKGITSAAGETLARTGGKVAVDAAKDIPVIKSVMKGGKLYQEAAAETAARRGAAPVYPGATLPEDPGTFPGAPEPAAPPKELLQAKGLQTGGKAVSEPSDALGKFPQYDAKPVPTQVNDAAPAQVDSAHPKAAEFEKTFGQPLENYMQDGKFNTKDFLDEVVKPKTEPPNYVMARHFGAESVPMVEELTGKPLKQWESSAPAGEPQGGSARLRAKQASAPDPSDVINTKDGEVSARGFLKKVGADEQSILNGAGRTPGEHADSVNYHRGQIKAGTSEPVELHLDQDKNVIGADGRHRALAAIQEGGPDAKVKVRIVQHRFQGSE